jgi:hypothetical protein
MKRFPEAGNKGTREQGNRGTGIRDQGIGNREQGIGNRGRAIITK